MRPLLIICSFLLYRSAAAEVFTADQYLDRVMDLAPEVKSAQQSYKAAQAQYAQSITDAWLPAVNASASENPWGNNPLNSNIWNSWETNARDVTYSFGASWNVF